MASLNTEGGLEGEVVDGETVIGVQRLLLGLLGLRGSNSKLRLRLIVAQAILKMEAD